MLTNFVFLAMVASWAVYGAARFSRPFEQNFPLAVMSLVLILFGFGLADVLEAGMILLYILTLGLYALTIVHLVKKRNIRSFLENLLTPGAVFFMIACGLLTLWNHGKVASGWDEFSHWVDIVKAVTNVGDFGTNPAAGSAFQSYPPAMMLFQYSLQKIYVLVKPGFGFSEWRVYFAFQVFILSVMLPFFRGITFRQPVKLLLYGAIAFLAPLLFYQNLYSAVYIDPVLGILFGAGMSMVLLRPERDGWYIAYCCLICAMLTLSKDVGFVFALALAGACALDCFLDAGSVRKKRLLATLPAFAAAWLPKVLWEWEIKTSGARVSFSGKVQWNVLVDIFMGRDTSYRGSLIPMYWDALQTKMITLGQLPVKLNYITLTLVFLGLSAGTLAAYILGLCVIYMFKFSEYEATRLASMDRYLNIAFLGIWLLILLLSAQWISEWCRRETKMVLLLLVLLVVPVRPFVYFIRGDYVRQSVAVRAPYETLSAEIRRVCDGDDRIYFVSQESSGFDYWVSRFNARPNYFSGNYTWSIGEPFYEGDVWTARVTPEEWQSTLLEQYDYVALYKINDYFLEHFAELFAEPAEIKVNTLYRVDRETRLLVRCE